MIFSKYGITLRTVTEQDAQFILDLRTDPDLNEFISSTSNDINQQIDWIRKYKEREINNQELYFITLDNNGNKCGTTRLYNFRNNKFELGSWIFLKEAPFGVSIKADILSKEIAFEELKFDTCTFEVRKKNLSVIKYHKMYQPAIIGECEKNWYFELSKENFNLYKTKFLNLFIKEGN